MPLNLDHIPDHVWLTAYRNVIDGKETMPAAARWIGIAECTLREVFRRKGWPTYREVHGHNQRKYGKAPGDESGFWNVQPHDHVWFSGACVVCDEVRR